MINNKIEFNNSSKLSPIEHAYFMVPAQLIYQTDLPSIRISVFAYLSMTRGIDFSVRFSILDIIAWMNKKSDRHSNGVNEKIRNCIEDFIELGYLSLKTPLKNDRDKIEATINPETLQQLVSHTRFAVLYTDEVKKLLSYSSSDALPFCTSDNLLLVFAYLRLHIAKRPNELKPEECNMDNLQSLAHDIECRRMKLPEVYNTFLKDIAADIGLSEKIVSTAVNVLHQLELIYHESLPRSCYDGVHWRTDHTLFANVYKREMNLLLASGQDYYLPEIKNKKAMLSIYKKNRYRYTSAAEGIVYQA